MITRDHTPEGVDVTFTMIPFRTVRVEMVIADVDAIIPAAEQNTYHRIFINLEGHTKSIRFGDDLPLEWQGLREYWQARTRRTADNFDLFFELVSTDVTFAWWDAFKATRDITNAAPPELSAEAENSPDPNSASDAPKPSQTSKTNGKPPRKSVSQQLGLTPAS